ncbi:MAG: OB-fold putative lipoprotein [Planctomycetia bacterium]|nr:OB-fold putative lipoprotein [Planctomycetia bacterium]
MLSSRLPALVAALAAFAFVIGCVKVEVKDPPKPQDPNPTPAPGGNPLDIKPKEEDKSTPIEFRTAANGADWSGVKPGDSVRVIGKCEGTKGNRIEFESAGRYYGSRPVVPASEVSSAFKTDPTAAHTKYKGRIFAVEGVCAKVTDRELHLSGSKPATDLGKWVDPRLSAAKRAKTDITVAARDLITAKKDTEYKGKMVEVTGKVQHFEMGPGSGAAVSLGDVDTSGKLVSGVVHARLLEFEPWNRLTYDQTVTIRGKCLSVGGYAEVTDCVILNEGPSPVIAITAEELAKEYKQDKKGTDAKYYTRVGNVLIGKSLAISGEIVSWQDSKTPQVTLKGADGVKVQCYLAPGFSGFLLSEAPVGAKVTVIAQYTNQGNNETVQVNHGVIRMTPP